MIYDQDDDGACFVGVWFTVFFLETLFLEHMDFCCCFAGVWFAASLRQGIYLCSGIFLFYVNFSFIF
jgi:hypothetical protein